jgi:hypothetical protein
MASSTGSENRLCAAGGELPHLGGIEAGESRNARRHALDCLSITFAVHEIAQIIAGRIVLDFAQRIAVERRGAFHHGRRHRRQARDPRHRIVAALGEIAEVQHR